MKIETEMGGQTNRNLAILTAGVNVTVVGGKAEDGTVFLVERVEEFWALMDDERGPAQ